MKTLLNEKTIIGKTIDNVAEHRDNEGNYGYLIHTTDNEIAMFVQMNEDVVFEVIPQITKWNVDYALRIGVINQQEWETYKKDFSESDEIGRKKYLEEELNKIKEKRPDLFKD